MIKTVLLVGHTNPPQDIRTLFEGGEGISGAICPECKVAQQALASLLGDGVTPHTPAPPHDLPCCEDEELRKLIAKLPDPNSPPTVEALLGIDHHKAGLLGARVIWAVKRWMQEHSGPMGIAVLDRTVLDLAIWSTSGGLALRDQEAPRVFELQLAGGHSTAHAVTFRGCTNSGLVRIHAPR